MTHVVHAVASSAADDAAYLALADIARMTADMDEVRIVGGHMVSLLLGAFPTPGIRSRRTVDADAALAPLIAASGEVHTALIEAGYTPINANSYRSGERKIDLLVPSRDGRFLTQKHGGRAFDAVPGLLLAISGPSTDIALTVVLTDDTSLDIEVRVPPVEMAVVLKALATRSRHEPKDIADLDGLLRLVHHHGPDVIGGWRLAGEAATRGTRRDAAAQLHTLASRARRDRGFRDADVDVPRFQAIVQRLIAVPNPSGERSFSDRNPRQAPRTRNDRDDRAR